MRILMVVGLFLLVFVFGGLILSAQSRGGGIAGWVDRWISLAFLVVLIGGPFVACAIMIAIGSRAEVQEARKGKCPRCGYPLAALPEYDDRGRRRCPECGGVIKVPTDQAT